MKRLVGGDYLLDLSPIEIEESVDGETYTSITDKSVLDQLTGLKAFIGKSGMIKPIWVKLLNGETDEIVATRGSLSTSDGVTFLIKVLLAGFTLTLSVEFTQAETEDHTPLDEWYIDDNDAKYILTSEVQEIGAISELPVFENIVDKDGHKRFVEWEGTKPTIEGVTISYAKASLSGTHLMIVVIASITADTNFNTTVSEIEIPTWILDKLLPLWSTVIDYQVFVARDSGGSAGNISLAVTKESTKLVIKTLTSQSVTSTDKVLRAEFDFLIDNEETETPAP